jgi:hypothetical protein
MSDYITIDPSEHGDYHRGYIKLDGLELAITVTHEGLIMDLYDDGAGEVVGTFANTFQELAEFVDNQPLPLPPLERIYLQPPADNPELRCAWCGGPEPEGGWVEMAPNFRICSYECSENY